MPRFALSWALAPSELAAYAPGRLPGAEHSGRMVVAEMSQERADKYRRKAEEYRLKALKAPRDYDKAAWLKLAEDWQQLADRCRVRARLKIWRKGETA